MAIRNVSIMLAALIPLAGCASPYKDLIKQASDACQQGDRWACDRQVHLQADEQVWKNAQAEKAAEAATLILGAAALGAAAGYSASHSQTTYYAPAPVYVAPTNCTSMALGGGMVTTNCY